MAYKSKHATKVKVKPEIALRLYQLQNPEIAKTIDRLYAKYGKYAVPAAELRQMLDKEMGQKTLNEELYAMRQGR